MNDKVSHVLSSGQTRKHECHWLECYTQVAPAMWGCRRHWFMLPKRLRDKIWNCYRIGQEADGKPSREYVKAAREVQEWIRSQA